MFENNSKLEQKKRNQVSKILCRQLWERVKKSWQNL